MLTLVLAFILTSAKYLTGGNLKIHGLLQPPYPPHTSLPTTENS